MSRVFLQASTGALLLLTLAAATGFTAGYESLLERGLFYLERGSTYGADAVRSLEAAQEADPQRARSDPVLMTALARAYVLTARYTEGYRLLELLKEIGAAPEERERLLRKLLAESGLGRIRLWSAVPVGPIPMRLELAAGARLDVTGRRAFEQVNELLERGLMPGPDGTTILVPEAEYLLHATSPDLVAPRDPVPLEIWAGEQAAVRLVPVYPPLDDWQVDARSRSILLRWPALSEAAGYRLFRTLGEGTEALLYEGPDPEFEDRELPVGETVRYRLEILDGSGRLLAGNHLLARTLPPVDSVRAEAALTGDLTVEIEWVLSEGAVDEVRLVREAAGEEQQVIVLEPKRRDAYVDGPFLPEEARREVRYRVQSWIEGAETPSAAAQVGVEIPPRVQRITEVAETIERGVMVVGWETLPREGLAEGFLVYRQRDRNSLGELAGRVRNPFAREFEYPVEDPLAASAWRHVVVPYVGEHLYFDPDWLQVSDRMPESSFTRRKRSGDTLPDLALSWDPYPATSTYRVRVGEQEELVGVPYVELKGLQNRLAGSEHPIEVYAVEAEGRSVLLLRGKIQYFHYPRTREDREIVRP